MMNNVLAGAILFLPCHFFLCISQSEESDPSYKVPCNLVPKLPRLAFVFAGKNFLVESHVYIQKVTVFGVTFCLSPFVASDSNSSRELWVIGGAFMSQYYTEFDLGKNRVGFAVAR